MFIVLRSKNDKLYVKIITELLIFITPIIN